LRALPSEDAQPTWGGPAPAEGARGAALNEAVRRLRAPATIRQRCAAITAMVARGDSAHFTLVRSQLAAVAQRVAALTRERFPTLEVPFHSRWRHFEAGGIHRKAELDSKLNGRSQTAVARSRIDQKARRRRALMETACLTGARSMGRSGSGHSRQASAQFAQAA
jgi:hypothetical protein